MRGILIISMIMVCSFTSIIAQNSTLVKGNFILDINNNILYSTFSNDEADEFKEKNLLLMNLVTKREDTLIRNAFFIDVEKFSDNEIIMTDGNTISIYNINSKQTINVYSLFDDDMTILDVITNEKDIYFFVRDYNYYKVLFYQLLPNNNMSLLHSFKYAELENPGLNTFLDNNYSYIRVNGDLYSFHLKSKTTNKLTDEYVYSFNFMNDTLFYISHAEDITSLKSISKDNLKQDIIIENFLYHHPDNFFIFNNSLYIHTAIGKQSYKIINKRLIPTTKIPLIDNNLYSIHYINGGNFELIFK